MSNDQRYSVDNSFRDHVVYFWTINIERWQSSFKATIDFGLAALRGAFLLNAAGVAGTAAYINTKSGFQAASAKDALFWFGIALLIASSASAAAYIAQALFTFQIGSRRTSWDPPFVHETTCSTSCFWIGTSFQILSMILVIISYTMFGVAGYIMYIIV